MFFIILTEITSRGRLVSLDVFIASKISQLWNPLLNKIMIFTTNLISLSVLIPLVIFLTVFLLYKRKWLDVLILYLSLAGGGLLETALKLLIKRPRPLQPLLKTSHYSFPSGHATLAIILFLLIIYYFKNYIQRKTLKFIFIAFNCFIFISVGFSRIYLKAHWLTDVAAGFALGAFWLTFIILIFNYYSPSPKQNTFNKY